MRTKVRLEVDLLVEHKDAKALREAIRDFKEWPTYGATCSIGYSYKMGKPRVVKRHSGDKSE